MSFVKTAERSVLALSILTAAGCGGSASLVARQPATTSGIGSIRALAPQLRYSKDVSLDSSRLIDGHLIQAVNGSEMGVVIDGRFAPVPVDTLGGDFYTPFYAGKELLIGQYTPGRGETDCFLWKYRTGSIVDIGRYVPHGLSPDGTKAGFLSIVNQAPYYIYFVYDTKSGTFTQLVDPLDSSRSPWGISAIADDGSGVMTVLDNQQVRSVRFDSKGKVQQEELQPQAAQITIRGANTSGALVGTIYDGRRVPLPGVWQAGQFQPTYLTVPKSGAPASADCINDAGAIGGRYEPEAPSGHFHAVIWPEGAKNPKNVVDINASFGGRMGLPDREIISDVSGFDSHSMLFYGETNDAAGNRLATREFVVR